MDWGDYASDPLFTGRSTELDLLGRAFFEENSRVIVLNGEAGIGKSALALKFAQKNSLAFPAGSYHIHASPYETLKETIDAHVSHPNLPYLLILDSLDVQAPNLQYREIVQLQHERPSAKILCIARHLDWSTKADVTMRIPGLISQDVKVLLARLGFSSEIVRVAQDHLGGNPLFAQMVAGLLDSVALNPREIIERLSSFKYSCLLGPDGRPLAKGASEELQICSDIRLVTDDLLRRVHNNPQLLHQLTPRKFEEFIADLLSRLGYEVHLTPASKDGGFDIRAAQKSDLGTFLFLVECKKYAPNHKVGVALIRELHGVVQAERATAGILATTSFFTKDAKQLQGNISNHISLKDYIALQEWMAKALKK